MRPWFRPFRLLLSLGLAASPLTASAVVQLPDARTSTIQDALNNLCPEVATNGTDKGCHLQLPCGEFLADRTGSIQVDINGLQHVKISGCGMDGTTIKWDPGSTSQPTLLAIRGGSRFVTIEDVRLEIDCSGSCSSASWTVNISSQSSGALTRDITFERVHIHAAGGTSGEATVPWPTALGIGGGSQPVERVTVYQSNIHATGYGLNSFNCSDCWYSGNWLGPITGRRQAYALANKYKGVGVRFTNNSFDLGGDVLTGLYLRSDPTDPAVSATAQVIGNSFVNLQDDVTGTFAQRALFLYRYNLANIQGNLFSCVDGDPGCTALGIDFLNGGVDSYICPTGLTCNKENLIADNVFNGIVDDNSLVCGIRLHNAVDANFDNIIRGNIFRLGAGSATGADGLCGAKSTSAINPQHENRVFGP